MTRCFGVSESKMNELRVKLTILLLLLVTSELLGQRISQHRNWYLKNGEQKVVGSFIETSDDKVRVSLANGSIVSLKLRELSKSDRIYLEGMGLSKRALELLQKSKYRETETELGNFRKQLARLGITENQLLQKKTSNSTLPSLADELLGFFIEFGGTEYHVNEVTRSDAFSGIKEIACFDPKTRRNKKIDLKRFSHIEVFPDAYKIKLYSNDKQHSDSTFKRRSPAKMQKERSFILYVDAKKNVVSDKAMLLARPVINDALSVFQKSIRLAIEPSSNWYLHEARRRFAAKDYSKAIQRVDDSLALVSTRCDALLLRGFANENLKNHNRAIEDFTKVIRFSEGKSIPTNNDILGKALLRRSVVFAKIKSTDDSLVDLRSASQLDSLPEKSIVSTTAFVHQSARTEYKKRAKRLLNRAEAINTSDFTKIADLVGDALAFSNKAKNLRGANSDDNGFAIVNSERATDILVKLAERLKLESRFLEAKQCLTRASRLDVSSRRQIVDTSIKQVSDFAMKFYVGKAEENAKTGNLDLQLKMFKLASEWADDSNETQRITSQIKSLEKIAFSKLLEQEHEFERQGNLAASIQTLKDGMKWAFSDETMKTLSERLKQRESQLNSNYGNDAFITAVALSEFAGIRGVELTEELDTQEQRLEARRFLVYYWQELSSLITYSKENIADLYWTSDKLKYWASETIAIRPMVDIGLSIAKKTPDSKDIESLYSGLDKRLATIEEYLSLE